MNWPHHELLKIGQHKCSRTTSMYHILLVKNVKKPFLIVIICSCNNIPSIYPFSSWDMCAIYSTIIVWQTYKVFKLLYDVQQVIFGWGLDVLVKKLILITNHITHNVHILVYSRSLTSSLFDICFGLNP